MIPYNMTKRLITMAVVGTEEDDDDDEAFIYIKKSQKREWLRDMLESEARDDTIERSLLIMKT